MSIAYLMMVVASDLVLCSMIGKDLVVSACVINGILNRIKVESAKIVLSSPDVLFSF